MLAKEIENRMNVNFSTVSRKYKSTAEKEAKKAVENLNAIGFQIEDPKKAQSKFVHIALEDIRNHLEAKP